LTVLLGAVIVLCLTSLPETHPGIILDRKARRLRTEGRKDMISPMETGDSREKVFAKYLSRPLTVITFIVNSDAVDAIPESDRVWNEYVSFLVVCSLTIV